MNEFNPHLIGERIELKKYPVSFEMAKKLFDLEIKNVDHLIPYEEWILNIKKPEDVFFYIKAMDSAWKKQNIFAYGMFLNNKLIGQITAHDYDVEINKCEISYWLGKEFTGNGYMTEAVKLLENDLFKRLEINRIEMGVDPKNTSSENLIKKAGYVREGLRRDFYYYSGKLQDSILYSKLKKE